MAIRNRPQQSNTPGPRVNTPAPKAAKGPAQAKPAAPAKQTSGAAQSSRASDSFVDSGDTPDLDQANQQDDGDLGSSARKATNSEGNLRRAQNNAPQQPSQPQQKDSQGQPDKEKDSDDQSQKQNAEIEEAGSDNRSRAPSVATEQQAPKATEQAKDARKLESNPAPASEENALNPRTQTGATGSPSGEGAEPKTIQGRQGEPANRTESHSKAPQPGAADTGGAPAESQADSGSRFGATAAQPSLEKSSSKTGPMGERAGKASSTTSHQESQSSKGGKSVDETGSPAQRGSARPEAAKGNISRDAPISGGRHEEPASTRMGSALPQAKSGSSSEANASKAGPQSATAKLGTQKAGTPGTEGPSTGQKAGVKGREGNARQSESHGGQAPARGASGHANADAGARNTMGKDARTGPGKDAAEPGGQSAQDGVTAANSKVGGPKTKVNSTSATSARGAVKGQASQARGKEGQTPAKGQAETSQVSDSSKKAAAPAHKTTKSTGKGSDRASQNNAVSRAANSGAAVEGSPSKNKGAKNQESATAKSGAGDSAKKAAKGARGEIKSKTEKARKEIVQTEKIESEKFKTENVKGQIREKKINEKRRIQLDEQTSAVHRTDVKTGEMRAERTDIFNVNSLVAQSLSEPGSASVGASQDPMAPVESQVFRVGDAGIPPPHAAMSGRGRRPTMPGAAERGESRTETGSASAQGSEADAASGARPAQSPIKRTVSAFMQGQIRTSGVADSRSVEQLVGHMRASEIAQLASAVVPPEMKGNLSLAITGVYESEIQDALVSEAQSASIGRAGVSAAPFSEVVSASQTDPMDAIELDAQERVIAANATSLSFPFVKADGVRLVDTQSLKLVGEMASVLGAQGMGVSDIQDSLQATFGDDDAEGEEEGVEEEEEDFE
jgi:hypothetical protein